MSNKRANTERLYSYRKIERDSSVYGRGRYTSESLQAPRLKRNKSEWKYLDLHMKNMRRKGMSTPQRYPVSAKPNLGRVVTRSGQGPTGIYIIKQDRMKYHSKIKTKI